MASYEPFIEYWGDYVHAPWAEAWDWPVTDGDIHRSERYLVPPNDIWLNPPERISLPDGFVSASPVNVSGDVFVYAEHDEGGTQTLDPEFYSLMTSRRGFVDQTPVVSTWPHSLIYSSPAGDPDLLLTLWTEGSPPGSYIQFKSTDMSGTWNREPRVFYPVTCGGEQASPYCKSRAGYRTINSYGIDYGDSLVYHLLFLDPCYDFAVRLAGIHGGSTNWEQELVVDGQGLISFAARPVTLETLRLMVPLSLYEKDHAVQLVLKKKSGSYAFCQGIKLYRSERLRKKGSGGGQSVVTATMPGQFSLEIVPNPVGGKTRIRFTLPAPTSVGIKVFDITGRVVRGLACREYASGQHVVSWEGRDDAGKPLPSGVYFVTVETGHKKLTRKVLLIE